MSSPVLSDVHVSSPLTDISIAYLQSADSFVASQVFPNIPVSKQADRYYTYDRGEFNRDEMQKRAPGTESAGGSYTVDNTPNYFCDKWAFHKDVPDDIRSNEDNALDSDRDAVNYLSHKSLIRKERVWATNYFASGIWITDVTPANLWSTDDGAPVKDVRTGRRTVQESAGIRPNVMVIGQLVEDALYDNPDVVDRIKYGQVPGAPADVTNADLAQLFKLDRVLTMRSIYNTAQEGQAASHSFIGGANALLCYSAPRPGLLTPSAGYTFSWTGLFGAGALGSRIKKFRLEREASDRIEIEMAFDMKLVSADLGYFFDTVAS